MDPASGVICNIDRCSWNWEQPTVNQRLWTDVWLWDSPGTSRFWSTALWTPPDPVYQSRLSAAEVQELFADGLDLHTYIILSFLTNMSEFKPAAVLQTLCCYWLMGWQMTHWLRPALWWKDTSSRLTMLRQVARLKPLVWMSDPVETNSQYTVHRWAGAQLSVCRSRNSYVWSPLCWESSATQRLKSHSPADTSTDYNPINTFIVLIICIIIVIVPVTMQLTPPASWPNRLLNRSSTSSSSISIWNRKSTIHMSLTATCDDVMSS